MNKQICVNIDSALLSKLDAKLMRDKLKAHNNFYIRGSSTDFFTKDFTRSGLIRKLLKEYLNDN